jgi:signal peptidase II
VPDLGDRVRRLPVWLPALLVALLVGADQALKAWALANLTYGAPPVPVIPGVLDWTLTFNTGAAWSLFSGSTVPLAVGRLLVGLGLLVYLWRRPQPPLPTVLLSMIAAGAIGNAIDGFTQTRGVTDMIHAPFLSFFTRLVGQGDFPIFNLADMCVVLGTIALVVSSFLAERRPKAGALE